MIGNVDGKMRRFRTHYPYTGEIIDTWAENATEVYSATLRHGGSGLIKVETPDGWRTVLGFEHPGVPQKKLSENKVGEQQAAPGRPA